MCIYTQAHKQAPCILQLKKKKKIQGFHIQSKSLETTADGLTHHSEQGDAKKRWQNAHLHISEHENKFG